MIKSAKFIVATLILLTALALSSCADKCRGDAELSPQSDTDAVETIENDTTETEETTMPIYEEVPHVYNTDSVYYQYADESAANLIANYWYKPGKIFYDGYPKQRSSAFNYWWYAHAIDVMADAYIRTKDESYITYIDDIVDTIVKRNKKITNDYYDDMEWMALALLRMYDETKDEKYLDNVQILWNDIKTGWNDTMGGGIAWRKEQLTYKNTPANAPAAILAARLYKVTKDEADLEWAVKIYDFQKANLVDPSSGQVWDGINRENNGKIDKNWNFTYCHGVYIGAGVELYKITGDETYLADAKKTAAYALIQFTDERRGTFKSEGDGDGGLFKGILIRYLTQLYKVAPEMVEIKETIIKNADILRDKGTNAEGNFTNTFFLAPKDGNGSDLSTQLSGCMLFEAAAYMD